MSDFTANDRDDENAVTDSGANASEETSSAEITADEAESTEAVAASTLVQPESTIFVKHTYDTKKPAKNGNFRRIITCVTAFVLCAAIGGSVFLIKRLLPEVDNTSSTASFSEESIPLVKYDDYVKPSTVEIDGNQVEIGTNIKSVSIYNYYEHYSFLPYYEASQDDGTSSADVSSGEEAKTYDYTAKYYIGGIDRDLTSPNNIADHIKSCMNVTAIKEMENTFGSDEEYYKYYGFDDPTRELTVHFTDGTESLVVTVGSQLAGGKSNYVRVGDNGKVYVLKAETVALYDYLPIHFGKTGVVTKMAENDVNKPYFNNDSKLAKFDYIRLSGRLFGGKTISFGMSKSASADYMPYVMTAPYTRPANGKFIEEILGLADYGLEADSLYSFNATEENREQCGLNDPNCVIEFGAGDYSFKLTLGGTLAEDADTLTAMIDDKKPVFAVKLEDFKFISDDITTMFNSDFIMEDIYTVSALTLKDKTGEYRFDLTHTPRPSDTSVTDTTVKYNGNVTDTQSFKYLYQRIVMLTMLSFVTEAEHTEPVFSVRFSYPTGPNMLVEFTESPTDLYHFVAWVDGIPLGDVLKSSVTDITDSLATYVSGGTVKEP